MNDIFNILKGKRILFVLPHPDDEYYSCSALIARLVKLKQKAFLLFVSHGAPAKQKYLPPLSIKYSYSQYCRLYRKELHSSLKMIGINDKRVFLLNYDSGRAIFSVAKIYKKVTGIIRTKKIDAVFSCPYEGAHADHEVVSFISSAVRKRFPWILNFEYVGYWQKNKKLVSGKFLKGSGKVLTLKLSRQDKKLKRAIFEGYKTQSFMLRQFPVKREVFRSKPDYDYSLVPAREIYYESWQKELTASMVLQYLTL